MLFHVVPPALHPSMLHTGLASTPSGDLRIRHTLPMLMYYWDPFYTTMPAWLTYIYPVLVMVYDEIITMYTVYSCMLDLYNS